MGIKEKELPLAESLGAGDKVRIVTAEGKSKQIDSEAIGGGGFIVNITPNGNISNVTSGTTDKTYDEILAARDAGKLIFAYLQIGNGGGPDARMVPLAYNGYNGFDGASVVYYFQSSTAYELKIEIKSGSCSVVGRAL